MAISTTLISPFDPNIYTGPVRAMAGVARYDVVTLDTAYGAGATGTPEYARWLYVGAQGDVSVKRWDGTTVVIPQLVAGVWHPIYSIMVNSSGTTATGILWGS